MHPKAGVKLSVWRCVLRAANRTPQCISTKAVPGAGGWGTNRDLANPGELLAG